MNWLGHKLAKFAIAISNVCIGFAFSQNTQLRIAWLIVLVLVGLFVIYQF